MEDESVIEQHLNRQERAIMSDINAASQAWGDTEVTLEGHYSRLFAILVVLEGENPRLLDILGSGYFSAFADAKGEWDNNLKRAKMTLTAMASRMGEEVAAYFHETLRYFIDMKERNIAAARIFGRALCRMHPKTVRLAEEAAA